MARSHAVWVVTQRYEDLPVAAFTVKHELISWLRSQPATHRKDLWVTRLPDGPVSGECPDVSAEDFIK